MSQSIVQVSETPQLDTSQKLTFEQYRFYQFESEPDGLYELYKGKLIPMPTATFLHTRICEFLVYKLQRYLAAENLDLVVKTSVGVRTKEDSSRIPDVVVCSHCLWQQIAARPGAGILDFEEVPLLVVEVVSDNRRQDYVIKRSEYEGAGVPGYWILDSAPNKQKIRILSSTESADGYNHIDFFLGQEMVSVQFPNLVLSVNEILNPPVVETLIKEEQDRLQQAEQQANEERQRADEERQRADEERLRADEERQRADEERLRAERLAARLREMGVDPDSI